MRADQALVERGLAPSRSAAQRLIGAGAVKLRRATDVSDAATSVRRFSETVAGDDELSLIDDAEIRFASRAGIKLEAALQTFAIEVSGMHCLDVGQSTGGFTDCLRRRGAASVVGVDVGRAQLDARLRADPAVVPLEGVNARTLTESTLRALLGAAGRPDAMPKAGFDIAVVDVSFISLTLVLPVLPPLLRVGGCAVALVKPQFEVGPHGLDARGVVRDAGVYPAIRERVADAAAGCGLTATQWHDSPVTGTDGNREFLLHVSRL